MDDGEVVYLDQDILHSWHGVGDTQSFTSHREIAAFLIQFYEDGKKGKVRDACVTCGSALSDLCDSCQVRRASEKTSLQQSTTGAAGEHCTVVKALLSNTVSTQTESGEAVSPKQNNDDERLIQGHDSSPRSRSSRGHRSALGTHAARNRTNRRRLYECSTCKKLFISESFLHKHEVKAHTTNKIRCQLCGEMFFSLAVLKIHKAQAHAKVHKAQAHDSQRQHKCTTCNKVFNRLSNLKKRSATHKHGRQFHCDLCPSTFKYPENLLEHTELKHSNVRETSVTRQDVSAVDDSVTRKKESIRGKKGSVTRKEESVTNKNESVTCIESSVTRKKHSVTCKSNTVAAEVKVERDIDVMGCEAYTTSGLNLSQSVHQGDLNGTLVPKVEIEFLVDAYDDQPPTVNTSQTDKPPSVIGTVTDNDESADDFKIVADEKEPLTKTACGENTDEHNKMMFVVDDNADEDTEMFAVDEREFSPKTQDSLTAGQSVGTAEREVSSFVLSDFQGKTVAAERDSNAFNKSLDDSTLNQTDSEKDMKKKESQVSSGLSKSSLERSGCTNYATSMSNDGFPLNEFESEEDKKKENLESAQKSSVGRYSCTTCQESFDSVQSFKYHCSKHRKKAVTCDTCGYTCLSVSLLKRHQLTHKPKENKNVLCQICGTGATTVSALKSHRKRYHSVNSNFCKVCKAVFDTLDELKAHRVEEHPEKYTFSCKLCNKACSRKVALERHMITHTDLRPHPCQTCGKTFKSRDTLKLHMDVHTDSDNLPFVCEWCGKGFKRKGPLNIHKATHNDPKPSFRCDVCPKAFATKDKLSAHRIRHSKNFPHVCDFCGKGFRARCGLTQHLEMHTQTVAHLPCKLCGKKFTTKRNVNSHIRFVHTQRSHSCVYCSKDFKTTGALKQHLRTHTGERPFKCEVCSQAFADQSTLRQHKYTHTGRKPYACSVCHMSFARSADLEKHRLTHDK